MRHHFTHLAALSAGCLALVWACGYEAETPVVDAAEMRSPLFDHEIARNRDAQVDVTAACIDIEATLREWQNADGDADTDAKRKRLIEGLVVMTTVAFQSGQFSTDANVCSTSGKNTCSTSTGPGTQGPYGCSTATGTSSCTTNNGATGAPFSATCSATASSGPTCSVFVPGGGGGSRSVCSTTGQVGGLPNICSAGKLGPGQAGTTTCSTAGGWGTVSNPPNGNGTAACSASDGGSCSATAGTTCSTYQGSHQSCSAGMTGTNQTACTALLAGGGGSCSVNNASNGAIQNKCSAIGNDNTGTGDAVCSASLKGGSTCSVYTTGANATCSSFPTTGQNPNQYVCSVNPSPPAAAVCSTVNTTTGKVTPPPTGSSNCGSGVSH
jgi:hypothetical protein